jgi:hypothetical protein
MCLSLFIRKWRPTCLQPYRDLYLRLNPALCLNLNLNFYLNLSPLLFHALFAKSFQKPFETPNPLSFRLL